jgi:hypothetical protein
MTRLSYLAAGLFALSQTCEAQTHDPVFLHHDFSDSALGTLKHVKTLDHGVYTLSYDRVSDHHNTAVEIIIKDYNDNKLLEFSEIDRIIMSHKTTEDEPAHHLAVLSLYDSQLMSITHNVPETTYFTQDSETAVKHMQAAINALFPTKQNDTDDVMIYLCRSVY